MAFSSMLIIAMAGLLALTAGKPIMVTYGTNQGPIVPAKPAPPPNLEARSIVPRSPAPVFEEPEDVPNPSTYKPLVPHQYRSKLYSFRPRANLILGTPIDQKYTPSLQKYNNYQKQLSRSRSSSGLEYTGPHAFDRQDYEFLLPSGSGRKSTTLQRSGGFSDNRNKVVPQIGVIYSSGVRYYVPQIVQQQQQQQDELENSVYDQNDQKYYN